MKKSSLVHGAGLITVAMFFSKIMGFLYIIPFTKMVGASGYILFEYAYKPYVIMISLATMGIPMAVSKFVSRHNEMGDYMAGRRLLRSGLLVLLVTGTVCASILYGFAPLIATHLVGESHISGNSLTDVIFVLRTISTALVIVPMMALVRGFFQGYEKMQPTATSQMVEQLVRICTILIGSYLVMVLGNQNIKFAVGIATFGAFLGGLASLIVLYNYWRKYKPLMNESLLYSATNGTRSLRSIYKELIFYSFPFVVVSLAIPIFQNIDLFSINPTLMAQGYSLVEAEKVNSVVSLVLKITTIPIVFANALAISLVPSITNSHAALRKEEVKEKIQKVFQIIVFVTLPCGIFLYMMPGATFSILLGTEYVDIGESLTRDYAFISVFFSLFVVSSAMMQGIGLQYHAIWAMVVGVLVKIALSEKFIGVFGGAGTAYSTMVGMGAIALINVLLIKRETNLRVIFSLEMLRKMVKVIIPSILVLVAIKEITPKMLIGLDLTGYSKYLLSGSVGGIIFMSVFVLLSVKENLLLEILEIDVRKILKKHRKE